MREDSNPNTRNTRPCPAVKPAKRFRDGRALRPMAGLLKPRKIRGQNDSKRGGKVLCGAFVGRVSARRQQGRAQHHSKSLAVVNTAVRIQRAVEVRELAVKRIGDD